MIRKIIKIDEEKCNGCGICAEACHEGAIGMVEGKAKLLREDYCDGLGDCLPTCPAGAISFEAREAPAYDEAAVLAAKQRGAGHTGERQSSDAAPMFSGCPGTMARMFSRKSAESKPTAGEESSTKSGKTTGMGGTALSQWPVQIKLVAPNAPYFNGADLLVAADCTAFAYGNFHNDFIKDRICIVGCPKLDMVDYSEKLTAILANNDVRSVTVVRMEVPCCGGLENAVKTALKQAMVTSDRMIPWQVVTISTEGRIL